MSESIAVEAESLIDNKALEEAIAETHARVKQLATLLANSNEKDFVTYESRTIVWKISRSYLDWDCWRVEISKALCEANFCDLAVSLVKRLVEVGPAVDLATFKISHNLLVSLRLFANVKDFRQMLSSLGVVAIFLDYLLISQTSLEQMLVKDPPEEYSSSNWTVTKSFIYVLYQLLKDESLKHFFLSSNALKIMAKFCTVEDAGVSLIAACCVAFLADSSRLRKLCQIKMIEGLKQALEKCDRRCYCGISAKDIAEAVFLCLRKDEEEKDVEKVSFTTELILCNDPEKQILGSLLFRAFCGNVPRFPWFNQLLDLATDFEDNLDDATRERAVKAIEFIAKYNRWAKILPKNFDDNDGTSEHTTEISEVKAFPQRPNEKIESAETAYKETQRRARFLYECAQSSQGTLLISPDTVSVFGLILSSFHEHKRWANEMIAAAIEEKFPETAVQYLSYCISVGLALGKEEYLLTQKNLEIIWNFTDDDIGMRLELGKVNCVKVIADFLAKATENEEKDYGVIFPMTNVLYNMSRSVELKAEFLKHNVDNILKLFIVPGPGVSQFMKPPVVLCLAHILRDTEAAAKFAVEQQVISNLIFFTEKAIEDPKRRCAVIGPVKEAPPVFYSLGELVEGISLLAVNDSVKETLLKKNICHIISFLLKCGSRLLESLGVDLLWTMSFEKNARKEIKENEEDLVGSLRQLAMSADAGAEIRRNASRALAFIEKWEDQVATAKAWSTTENHGTSTGHVFISYSWKQQKTVMLIKQGLYKAGYKVWMDVDNMHGDLLEAMAKATEEASLVLLCFSNSYHQSNQCRVEAEYAHALRKKILPVKMENDYDPDGWLGILVKPLLYVDMSFEKPTIEEAIQQLIEQLNRFGIEKSSQAVEVARARRGDHDETKIRHAPVVALRPSNLPVTLTQRIWSPSEVQRWLQRENLQEFCHALSDFDGKMLATLFAMKATAPEFYYMTVSKHYNGTLQGLLKLFGVLDRLFNEIH